MHVAWFSLIAIICLIGWFSRVPRLKTNWPPSDAETAPASQWPGCKMVIAMVDTMQILGGRLWREPALPRFRRGPCWPLLPWSHFSPRRTKLREQKYFCLAFRSPGNSTKEEGEAGRTQALEVQLYHMRGVTVTPQVRSFRSSRIIRIMKAE